MSGRILAVTWEIIYLLTGEEYTAVKKTATPIIHPHSLIQKLLELTNKMTELLTGEVTAGNVGGHSSGGLWLMTGYCVVRFL
ncbi:hypothetical protein GDO78_018559 [Eleutherodactylus coqui]|uniref:Uncharacterized protein n=1 Tax=Eleutherodactylus coqui TaxID=57060 RepID=A0A8J6BHS6_ELECQ|nr:hypothetical protein GDO78_018559 [Eleutherodactylus coqui]